MEKKSKKRGKAQSFQVKSGMSAAVPIVNVGAEDISRHLDKDHASVSLRYYQKSCECFSDWVKHELKKFSQTIDKMRNQSVDSLKSNASLCEIHKGAPSEKRFSIPADLSPDLKFHEIKVDPSNKLRMHGFFSGSVFFLVWLDREHACFRSK